MADAPTIHQALNAVMRQVTKVSKSQKNSHFGFAFRGIEQVMESTGPAFREHGVIGPVPTVLDVKIEGTGKARTALVTVRYEFVGPRGDSLSTVVLGEAPDTIKALSIAERIALIQVLHIPTSQRDADAPPPNTTARVRLQNRAATIAKANGWQQQGQPDWDRVAAEYGEWSQGAEISSATDAELKAFLDSVEPKQTMKRGQ